MGDRPVAFITGASQGIGAETAKAFARRGHDVALLARNVKNLEKVAAESRQLGAEALVCPVDLFDLDAAERAVARAGKTLGRIDVLINNAAWREVLPLSQLSIESWEKTLRISLTAPAFLAKWCVPHMERQGKGVIINISSIQSDMVSGFSCAYMAAKGGLDTVTRGLAVAYGPKGIRTVGLNLGAIETDLSADYKSADGETITDQLRAWTEDMIGLRRWAQPEEIARCIVMFASDDASYINGANVMVEGGWICNASPYSFKKKLFPNDF